MSRSKLLLIILSITVCGILLIRSIHPFLKIGVIDYTGLVFRGDVVGVNYKICNRSLIPISVPLRGCSRPHPFEYVTTNAAVVPAVDCEGILIDFDLALPPMGCSNEFVARFQVLEWKSNETQAFRLGLVNRNRKSVWSSIILLKAPNKIK